MMRRRREAFRALCGDGGKSGIERGELSEEGAEEKIQDAVEKKSFSLANSGVWNSRAHVPLALLPLGWSKLNE